MSRALGVLCIVVGSFTAAACTQIRPREIPIAAMSSTGGFPHDEFESTLKNFADPQGRIDYAGLKASPARLEAYYARIAMASPDSDPWLFPQEAHRLAYWINAYNASVLRLVIEYYPISTVRDVGPPALYFLSRHAGFFYFPRIVLGGREINLRDFKDDILRTRFMDPRIHFALSSASRGCPRLRVFTGENVERMLDEAAVEFFRDPRNLRIDHQNQTVFLSSVLDWYEQDFLQWLHVRFPEMDASLLEFIVLYAGENRIEEVRWAAGSGYRIEFVDYDWRLNDQAE